MMRFLIYTAGTALCLCPVLWLFDFEEYSKLAWEIFTGAACLAFLWPFISAFLL